MRVNKSEWQLLQPIEDELKMCASRMLREEPLPPTLIMYGNKGSEITPPTIFKKLRRLVLIALRRAC